MTQPNDTPAISVSRRTTDAKSDIHCCFDHRGHKVDIYVPNAIPASDLGREHENARVLLVEIVDALAKALRR
jgi:hypothetical protein